MSNFALSARISEELHAAITTYCDNTGTSRTDLISTAVREFLTREQRHEAFADTCYYLQMTSTSDNLLRQAAQQPVPLPRNPFPHGSWQLEPADIAAMARKLAAPEVVFIRSDGAVALVCDEVNAVDGDEWMKAATLFHSFLRHSPVIGPNTWYGTINALAYLYLCGIEKAAHPDWRRITDYMENGISNLHCSPASTAVPILASLLRRFVRATDQ